MIVTCSKCSTKFKISDEKITEAGVKVRCSKCKHTFIVTTSGVREIDPPEFKSTPRSSIPPSSIPPSPASTSTLPPPPREQPLPPPPKIPETAPQPNPKTPTAASSPETAVTAIPDDIFASPTKVGPAPDGFIDGNQPLPPPPPPPPPATTSSAFEKAPARDSFPSLDESPTEKIPSPPKEAFGVIEPARKLPDDVVSSIDLDSDSPIMDAVQGKAPKDQDSSGPVLSEDLFSDLDSAVDKLAPPAGSDNYPLPEQTKTADTLSPDKPKTTPQDLPADDPFAGIDINVPAPTNNLDTSKSKIPDPLSAKEPTTDPTPPAVEDDPFSDIDISPGSDIASVAGESQGSTAPEESIFKDPFASLPQQHVQLQDQPASEPTKEPEKPITDTGGDLFSDLGDPFEGLGQPSAEEPPPVPQGSNDDLSNPLPSGPDGPGQQQDIPAPGEMDLSVGHDPFAGLDSADSFSGEQPQLEIGLALGEDGQVQGEDLPPGPLPTKTLATSEQQAQSPVVLQRPPGPPTMLTKPSDDIAPAGSDPVLFKILFGVVLFAVLFFAFVAFRHGGKPDLSKWSTYVEAFTGNNASFSAQGDLLVLDVASTTYKNREGSQLVVLWGKIRNNGPAPKDKVIVKGQLLRNNKPISSLSVPAGVVFTPSEVYSMLDAIAVKQAYAKKYKPEQSTVSSGKEVPFMIVMADHPDHLAGLKVRVVPDRKDDPLGTPSKTSQTQAPKTSDAVGQAAR